MSVEARRGCGYRKIGGLYLVSESGGVACDRLPIQLDVCPVCSHGFKQARGWTWIDVAGLVGGVHKNCQDEFPCPLCMATSEMGKAGLLWIGEKFYKTPEAFDREGALMGFSRRIKAVPRGFKVGETWILLAHPKVVEVASEKEVVDGQLTFGPVFKPGIFKVWRPSRIEKILPESSRGSAEAAELEANGITPVFVPDNDPDHRGTVYDEENGEEDGEK